MINNNLILLFPTFISTYMWLIFITGEKEDADGDSKKSSEKTQNVKAKKDIFRPYCLKDPDIKPFKLPYELKVEKYYINSVFLI